MAEGSQTDPAGRVARPSRMRRLLRGLLVGAIGLPLVFWVGATVVIKLTLARETPFGDLLAVVGRGIFGSIGCALGGCEAELIDGMTMTRFDESLSQGTLVALDVDERGRVLVAEAHRRDAGAEDNRRHDWLDADLAARTLEDRAAYQRDAIARGAVEDAEHFTRESDRLVVLEDEDGDGRADRRSELGRWNEALSGLVAGVEAREGEIWVASIPSLIRILDRDGDGVAEETRELVRGFGIKTSLGGHDLHGFAWGPDGKLYVSIGDRSYHVVRPDGQTLEPPLGPGRGAVFRMNPDGSDFEVFATGLRNPQELAFDDAGHLFTGDNNGDGGDPARFVYVVEGGDSGWAMPYQSLSDDYVRGPWMAERLFDLAHPTQPAWIVPPIAQIGNGPSGLVHYPGLGLPERYADHFFLCDYAYVFGRSGIWSFAVAPKGAGFELVDRAPFIWSVLAPDFDFSWDGRMFAALFDQFGDGRGIAVFEHATSRRDPRVADLARIAALRMADQTTDDLIGWLAFPDQRLRLRAQFELARRGAVEPLVALASDPEAKELARRHAIWGLGQLGASALDRLGDPGAFLLAAPVSLREALARVAGTAHATAWRRPLLNALGDRSASVRSAAAEGLGRIARAGDREVVEALFALVRENADRDVFLRHAAVRALERIGDLEAIAAHATDGNRSVRMAVLLLLRRFGDARIARFLEDPDPLVAVEAARAVYDVPIDGAMPALAARLGALAPAARDDRQVGEAYHRRAIGANVRLRSRTGAAALLRYAADERQLASLRTLALEQLARYAEPPVRDLTMGFHRPLAPIERSVVAGVLAAEGRALVETSLGARALEIASEYGVSPLSEQELVAVAEGETKPEAERVAAIGALRDRAQRGEQAGRSREVARKAMADSALAVRCAGRELLEAVDPAAGRAALLEAAGSSADVGERQHAWRQLASHVDDASVRVALAETLTAWETGGLPAELALEVFEAAARAPDAALSERGRALLAGSEKNPVESRRWALAGGDPKAGRAIFQGSGDCQRCHGDPAGQAARRAESTKGEAETGTAAGDLGHGGQVGPSLSGVARKGAEYALESVLAPDERIAEGYARPSAMPPMGLVLEPRALRDLVAYLKTLD